jgi:hypothetical protein
MTVLRRLHSDESGFTITELLVTLIVGMVILMAAFMVLDHSTSLSQEISNRQDALQRGRQAMERIVRDLRSQVCLGDVKEPITVAESNRVTFYSDLSDGSKLPEQRSIRYDPVKKDIYEDIYLGDGVYPNLTFTGPPETRPLVSGVEPILDGGTPRPILRYYAFDPSGAPGDFEQLPAPLTTANAIRVVLVKVGFVVLPDRKRPDNRNATTLESDIFVRIADPSLPLEGPQCI